MAAIQPDVLPLEPGGRSPQWGAHHALARLEHALCHPLAVAPLRQVTGPLDLSYTQNHVLSLDTYADRSWMSTERPYVAQVDETIYGAFG